MMMVLFSSEFRLWAAYPRLGEPDGSWAWGVPHALGPEGWWNCWAAADSRGADAGVLWPVGHQDPSGPRDRCLQETAGEWGDTVSVVSPFPGLSLVMSMSSWPICVNPPPPPKKKNNNNLVSWGMSMFLCLFIFLWCPYIMQMYWKLEMIKVR